MTDTRASRDLRHAATAPLARRLSPKYLEEHCLLPLEIDAAGQLVVAVGGPLDPGTVDELSLLYERPLHLVDVAGDEIRAAVLSAQAGAPLDEGIADLGAADVQVVAAEDEALDNLRALASQAPVIRLVNLSLLEALRHRASDVHLECSEQGLRVRQRIDGVLHDVTTHPRRLQAAVVSRVKIMADLNIAERRLPQDGRVRIRLSDRELDLRVSTLPTVHGESVVIRILDRGAGVRDLTELGMTDTVRATFERLVERPHGILLVTGPTGSGKTTTLYAALQRINRPGVKIVTVEDPVEYQLADVTQTPVNPKAGRTFATVLRSILRHDPDVIMVGEMRDRETSEIAIQAALTGHLVFSTLHTNDAPGGITRLVDMGIEPYLVSATVQGLLAQRLVRLVCDDCAEPHQLGQAERRAAEAAGVTLRGSRFRRGRGCEACSGTGYRGRNGIYELMTMSDALRDAVVRQAPLSEIRALALAEGMVPLHRAAWEKAGAGVTTLEEVARVTWDGAGA